jgi:8-oxo-dGTP pyrophosphatase MutT (NUDIX family)
MAFRKTTCRRGCCTIRSRFYDQRNAVMDFRHKYNKPKAGVYIHDAQRCKVLVVQSRGFKWGPPKGTVEDEDKTTEDCALRELYEETGIQLTRDQLGRYITVNRTTYYIVPFSETDELVVPDKDISGYAWMHIDCVRELDINSHCKDLLRKVSVFERQ